ncbi:MAG TPA: BlaI/MecI/CopY family transcriptional regulator [Rhodothermales bacterium]|nr:BlaI/MecI/CopY family transcriptional regulator [Rhodothermales bacterium]
MRRKKAIVPLGETEMEVLREVWDLGEATVADVHARLLERRSLAYTTVMTVLRKLAAKGYLSAERDGTRDRYRAARDPEEVRHSLLRDLMGHAFDGSPLALVQTLVGKEKLSDDERAEIRRLMDEM